MLAKERVRQTKFCLSCEGGLNGACTVIEGTFHCGNVLCLKTMQRMLNINELYSTLKADSNSRPLRIIYEVA